MFPFPNMLDGGQRNLSAFNPSDKDVAVTLSNGNRTMAVSSSFGGVRTLNGRASGRFYAEFLVEALGDAFIGFSGVGNRNPGSGGTPGAGWRQSGAIFVGSSNVAGPFTYTTFDRLGFAWDASADKFWAAKNGVWQFGDPVAGTGGLSYGSTGAATAMFPTVYGSVATVQVSIPTTSFYTPPAGFTSA